MAGNGTVVTDRTAAPNPEGAERSAELEMILMPVRGFVPFPGTVFPLAVERDKSVAAIERAVRDDLPIGIIMQRDTRIEDPLEEDLYQVGCICEILRFMTGPDGDNHVICRGTGRFELLELTRLFPFPTAKVRELTDGKEIGPQTEARFLHLRDQASLLLDLLPHAPVGLAESVREMTEPGALADLAVSFTDISPEDKQEVLETLDIDLRVEKVTRIVSDRIVVLRIIDELGQQAREALDERHREVILREQLAAIRRELGEEENGRSDEVRDLTRKAAEADLPENVEALIQREVKRYERLPEGAGEANMLRSWLDWMLELPWHVPEDQPIDLSAARRILDEDHYGLNKIKARIIEFLAVRKLAPASKAPILCFVGPPGVGKTSLGQSIARAMERPFARLSLGGVHDEAEIRGHRRTYMGAMPGAIMQAVNRAGSPSCVMMLDEIDKLGKGIGGDPAAALLEVLDPAQNSGFRDNYLGIDYDLSHVIFLTTANMLEGIPRPLADRMEVITLPGYTEEEKLEIANRYLIRRQLEATGLTERQVTLSPDALRGIIQTYTREAGVRGLERRIGAVFRHSAVAIAEGKIESCQIDAPDLKPILGAPQYENEVALRISLPGVATGLAWTPFGGDILFIEASRSPGKGALVLTGQLGEVMRESAQAALTLLKARAGELGIDGGLFERTDIHVHVPAGATPKDGPSAGVAIVAAMASLLLDRKLRSDTAMTGEISLRGMILPVGGIREKVVAAASAGIKRVLLPERNRHDFDDIPVSAREPLEFVWLKNVDDLLTAALEPR
ncbi:endopeptidase La [Thalassovita sp.]|uniref:endopeptidase La n=1 Tax=Thalassovita sp. TaxID=1979401 RepID=UPI0029DE6246|nr:endopeptidase La [Thalassovita sp.]